MDSNKPLRVALFGLGRAGKFHLQSIQTLPQIQLAHVVDVDDQQAQTVGEQFNCSYSVNTDAALNDNTIDAVIVATPTGEHHHQIMTSLKAGKVVFTEKPLGNGMNEITECFETARKFGKGLFVGFNRRFDPSFADLADQVRSGAIGTPQLMRLTSRDSPLPSMEYIRTSHGIFHDCMVHDFDMLRFITGQDPVEVYAIGSNFVDNIRNLKDLDNVLVSLKYQSGLLASIDVNRFASYGYDQRIEAFGGKGMVQAENRSPRSTVLSNDAGVNRSVIEHSFPTRYREAYIEELKVFQRCIANGESFPIQESDVVMSHVLCDKAEQSYKEGKPVKV
ncbi:MAG: Gfo/Idh/MocA family oxidoreductase [Verrucomicrobia bacterium]|jgi:myo-inositol 2-dehydrogenase / D-chiro-inositol 1-dehydrogenase|nr:Gfo/Idh/MocA family oxidoreductase [Verrucomicrobiota bacterium]